MADYERAFRIAHDEEREAHTIWFRCFDTPNSITVYALNWPDERIEDLLIGLYRECLAYHFLWSFSLPGSDVRRLNEPVASVGVDASTGWSACSDVVSATVVSESSLRADLLATCALIVASAGIDALAARHPGCDFTIIA